jgi:hypothetical protein
VRYGVPAMLVSAVSGAPEGERHLVGREPRVLEQIRDGSLSVVIWERRLPRGLRDALRSWAAAQEPPRFEGLVTDGAWVDVALQGFASSPARTFLAQDLQSLVQRFRLLTGIGSVKISFGAVTGDQCRKFHADYQRLRLITTYLGPGTEWLPEQAVRRDALVEPPACPATANQLIVRDPRQVRRAHAGDVLLLRGHDGVTGAALGAVHRSPAIEASRKVRVVLVASASRA